MNNGFIVATVALLLLLQLHSANAAGTGPYDGEWRGTARSTAGRCRGGAVINLTVEGQVVLGQAKFDDDTSNINGAVDQSGAVGATVGFDFLKGQFSGDEFEGSFKYSNCQWEAQLRRMTVGDRNRATTSGMR